MLGEILLGLVVGEGAPRILQRVKPRPQSEFDSLSFAELGRRNNWIERASSAIWIGSFALFFLCLLIFGLQGRSGWLVGFYFCFPATLMVAFVGGATLPQGSRRFWEFWRFHELKHKVHLGLLFAFYLPVAFIGFLSAVMLLAASS